LCSPEKREPDARATIRHGHRLGMVGHGVVVEEQAAADVEGHENVYAVVLVAGQDEKHAKQVHHPRRGVHVVPVVGCVWK